MYKTTKFYFHNKARETILKGVNLCYEAVRLSLGPAAGSALAYRTYARGPRIVDDGHTILQLLEPKDEGEKLVVEAFREGAAKTNERAGDGTATTAVICGKLIQTIFKTMSGSEKSYASNAKMNVQKIRKELLETSKVIKEKITQRAKKIESLEDLEKIAFVSLGNEEIGKVVASIVYQVGVDGFIDVVDGYKGELETEVIEGARFPAKIGAKAFINNPKRFEMVAEDAAVFLTNYKLDNDLQVRAAFSNIIGKNKKIVVLAPDFSQNVLTSIFQTVFVPNQQGGFARTGNEIYPVKVPALRTEQFEDLEVYFGAKFINKDTGKKLENVSEEDLGFVRKLVVKDTENREDAIAIGGRGAVEQKMKVENKEYKVSSPVSERIKILKGNIIEERIDSHKKLLERRIASLNSAVGIIRVGASTTAESLPLKLKIEDAQYACKSALEGGYVRGGGLCLKEVAGELGESIVVPALIAPYEQVQSNNEEPFEIGDDIIDPAKVVRLAVEHAISVAANLITVKLIVPEAEDANPSDATEAIAKALRVKNALWAKKEGIFKENLDEMEADHQRILEEHEGKD